MSRSIKKHGFVKDGGKHGKGVKFAKSRANKKVRRSTGQRPNPKGLDLRVKETASPALTRGLEQKGNQK